MRFRLKRGSPGSSASDPKLMFRYRDNNSSKWSSIRDISLGQIGEVTIPVEIRRTGIYQTRQYEISITDDTPVVMAKAEEDFTVLR